MACKLKAKKGGSLKGYASGGKMRQGGGISAQTKLLGKGKKKAVSKKSSK